MKRFYLSVVILFAVTTAAVTQPTPSVETIADIAEEAFIWGYPVVDSYAVLRSFALDPSSPNFKAPLNRISHAREVAGPSDTTIVAPNVDTPYSYAWLDLRAEPIILTLPPFGTDRYVSLQLIDAYTYILGYVTPRTNGTKGGRFLIAGPGWSGDTPPGIDKVFRSPTSILLAFYRTQILGPADLSRVHALQDQFLVQPLSEFVGSPAPRSPSPLVPVAPVDVRKNPEPQDFFRVLNWMMNYMPVLPEEDELRARFETIGIGAGRTFSPDAEVADAFRRGMAAGQAAIDARAQSIRSSAELFGSREFLGDDYLTRATAAMIGIYGNSVEEFLGVGYQNDADGSHFDGRYRYSITFRSDSLPDVGAFWSITIYTKDRFVYSNEINRCSIGSFSLDSLSRNTDGSLTIYLQHERPAEGKITNWLPIPNEPFGVTFRTYLPEPSIRNGTWQAPPVIRVP